MPKTLNDDAFEIWMASTGRTYRGHDRLPLASKRRRNHGRPRGLTPKLGITGETQRTLAWLGVEHPRKPGRKDPRQR